jgi:integrase
MARTVREANITSPEARQRLEARPKPYWRLVQTGLHLGYRKPRKGAGAWIARRFLGEHRYDEARIGFADDGQRADGAVVFSFAQAQEAARTSWRQAERAELGMTPTDGPYKVANALADYFGERRRKGSKGVASDKSASDARILPELGEVEAAKLTAAKIREWQSALADAPRLVRAKKGAMLRPTKTIDASDPDAVRARRATANRVLTILKAALNHAFAEGKVPDDSQWRKVKPFAEVDEPVVRFLTIEEARRLINTCPADFRQIVRGALLTGCRYGELCRMRANDFNVEAGTISVRLSKAGKPRHVALTDEGRELFAALTAGRAGGELIFRREDGKAWGPSHQQRPLAEASRRAKIEPAASFHILRHTYASALAMKGVPMGVIAAQLGHADTRMTEKHYAHLSPNYVADTIRANLPEIGGGEKSKVTEIRAARG